MSKALAAWLVAAALLSLPFVQTAIGAPTRAPKMRCTPRILHPGDTLKIAFPFPHGDYFDIHGPARSYFWLGEGGGGKPIIPIEALLKMKSIALNISHARGLVFIRRHQVVSMFDVPTGSYAEPARIFVKQGRYTLTVGINFETEAPYIEGSCTVRFEKK